MGEEAFPLEFKKERERVKEIEKESKQRFYIERYILRKRVSKGIEKDSKHRDLDREI